MEHLAIFYSSLGTVGIIIFLGFLLGKLKIIDADTNKHLINVLLNVAWPCAIFAAFPQQFAWTAFKDFLWGLGGGIAVLATVTIVSKLIFSKKLLKTQLSSEGQFAFIFNNASFLGYPLVLAIFGAEALLTYCGFILVFNLMLFSYGVYLFERKLGKDFWFNVATNPNILATLIGLVFFLCSWQLPDMLNQSINYLSAVMTPLSLICIGYMLNRAELSKLILKWKLGLIALAQLIVAPLATYGILVLIGAPPAVRAMLTLLQALPTATSLGLFAEKYGGDAVESSELVAISTLLSVVTLPVMILLLIA